jgi:hypothetical protein
MTSKIACMAARARAFPLDHDTRDLARTLKYEFDATDHEVGAALEMAAEQMRDEIERARRELRRHRTGS